MLKNYKKQWNDRTGAWMSEPLHNEASHGADAERTLACAHRDVKAPSAPDEKQALIDAQQARLKERQKNKRRAA